MSAPAAIEIVPRVSEQRPHAVRVLAIPGSLRVGSWNRRLLEAAAAYAPGDMSVRIHDLVGIPVFSEDDEGPDGSAPDAVLALRQAVRSSDALLIATPEYNQAMPGGLKNALDWLSRPAPDEVLAGKPVAVIGASAGRWGTRLAQAQLRQVLYATESLLLPAPKVYVRDAEALFDERGRLVDPSTVETLRALLQALGAWASLHATGRSSPAAAR